MSQYLSPRQFLRMAAVSFVVLIVVLAIIQSQRGNDAGIVAPPEHGEADTLVSELTRCRAVTLDQTALLETCRRLWAVRRRQFFAPTEAPPAPAEPLPSPATASGKYQDRLSPTDAKHQQSEVR
jgi:conjugative transfer region protein TrbK